MAIRKRKEFEDFHNDLKKYLELKAKEREGKNHRQSAPLSVEEMKERDSLHERLLRQKGRLKPEIDKLVGQRFYTQFLQLHDPWLQALNTSAHPGDQQTSLKYLIGLTSEAIGRLESIGPSWVDRTSFVYWGELFWTDVLLKIWRYAKSHKILSIVTVLATIISTIIAVLNFLSPR